MNSYSIARYYPIVTNLDEIIENENLLVDGHLTLIQKLHEYFRYDHGKTKILHKKVLKYRHNSGVTGQDDLHYQNYNVIKDLIRGNIVLLLPTSFKEDFLNLNDLDSTEVHVSQEKYFSSFYSFKVYKKNSLATPIIYM